VAPHCRLTKGYFFYDFQFVWCWTQTRRQTGLMTIFNAISNWLKVSNADRLLIITNSSDRFLFFFFSLLF
jgi:hypothetical protein